MTDARAPRARYRRIMRFALRYMVQEWWFELVLPRIGLGARARAGRTARYTAIARRFHVLAVDLGGLMIKMGQFMSSRLDVLPPEITGELEGLQDEVPAVAFDAIRALAEAELGVPLSAAYASFDAVPVAAASLGQAHRATLAETDAATAGFRDVVVKVQRPGIEQIVEVDLSALRRIAGWLGRVRFISQRVDLPALIEEFATTSLEEIDYLHEAGSAERFAQNFADDPRVEVPAVAWERTTTRVLTLSDVTAIKINDRDALVAAGIDPSAVAEVLAGVMFDQLFTDSFFHADPHPGNIFVTPVAEGQTDAGGDGRRWHLTFVDFGMMGEVPQNLRGGLRKLLVAVAARDGKGLVASIQDIGVLLPSADTAQLERAMTELFDRFGGMGFADLQRVDPREFEDFAVRFGDVVREMPFQFPESFLLIIRAVSLTSGVCSGLDPEFNIWKAVEPYADQLLRDERGGVVKAFGRQALDIATAAVRMPQRFESLAERIESGRLAVQAPETERRLRALDRTLRRVVSAVLFAGLLVGGILLLPTADVLGQVLMWVSIVPGLHAAFAGLAVRRRG